jgi:hypothetical protein
MSGFERLDNEKNEDEYSSEQWNKMLEYMMIELP